MNLSAAGQFGEAGLRALVGSPSFANLTHLDLSYTGSGDRAAKLIAQSPHAGRLRYLNLEGAGVSDLGGVALHDSPHLINLNRLRLAGNHLSRVRPSLKKRFGQDGVYFSHL